MPPAGTVPAWQAGCAAWLLSTVEASLLKHMLCLLRSLARRPARTRSPSLACEALQLHRAAAALRSIACGCTRQGMVQAHARQVALHAQSLLSSALPAVPNTHRSIIPLAPFGMADYDGGERFDLRVRKARQNEHKPVFVATVPQPCTALHWVPTIARP